MDNIGLKPLRKPAYNLMPLRSGTHPPLPRGVWDKPLRDTLQIFSRLRRATFPPLYCLLSVISVLVVSFPSIVVRIDHFCSRSTFLGGLAAEDQLCRAIALIGGTGRMKFCCHQLLAPVTQRQNLDVSHVTATGIGGTSGFSQFQWKVF